MLLAIADTADALTEPHQHHEPIYDRDQHRNRRMRRIWTTTQPGLLAALWQAVAPARTTTDDDSSNNSGFRSAPPLCVEALSRHTQIQIATVRWCWSLHIELRDTTDSNIRALVGAAGNLDSDTQHALLDELRQWRTWAAVMTGWQAPAYAPHVPCPNPDCQRADTLRVNLDRQTALCIACRTTWDRDNIGILADYIRASTEAA
jgi:hypothetical protein